VAKKKQLTNEELINKAVVATRLAVQREAKDVFKATEKRLYAYPVILLKIQDDEEMLEEVRTFGVHGKSKSITRFVKNGVRLSLEEIQEGAIIDQMAKLDSDRREAEIIEKALKIIESDQYSEIVKYKYFEGKSDEQIAELLNCDQSTVRRNKSRLIGRLSVFLYGARAVE
jgi:RNA polymerase sigma factor (sigma-70 family)